MTVKTTKRDPKAKAKPAPKARAKRPSKPKHPLMVSAKEWDRAQVMDHLCDSIATSELGLGSILLAGYQGWPLPSYSRVMAWIDEDGSLQERYARAREAQADFMADSLLNIADDARNDWMASEDPDNPGFGLNGENIQRSKLRVDTRKWLASKLKPKKYGDKVEQTHKVDPVDELPREIQLAIADRLRALTSR